MRDGYHTRVTLPQVLALLRPCQALESVCFLGLTVATDAELVVVVGTDVVADDPVEYNPHRVACRFIPLVIGTGQ